MYSVQKKKSKRVTEGFLRSFFMVLRVGGGRRVEVSRDQSMDGMALFLLCVYVPSQGRYCVSKKMVLIDTASQETIGSSDLYVCRHWVV